MNQKIVLVIGYGIMTQGIIKILTRSENHVVYLYSRHIKILNNGVRLITEDNLFETIICADFVITCFANCVEVDSFINNILLSIQSLHKAMIVDFTTSRIDYVEKFKKVVESRGGYYIEAPVTGSKLGSNSGKLSIFLHIDKCISYNKKELIALLQLISKKIYFFEKSTEPTKFKLIYNAWGAYLLYSIRLFNPLQFDFLPKSQEVVKEIVCSDGWMSLLCNSKLDKINNQDFDDIHFKIDYMVKDLEYANYSVFNYEVEEINYLLQQYKDCLINNRGKDFTVIGKNDDL